jgi:diguanylate cyclase
MSTTVDAEIQPQILLEIIQIQTEIARLGYDLGSVMAFVAAQAQALTGAAGCAVEIAEGDDMVYRAVAGSVASELGLRLKRESSLSGLSVKLGMPLSCEDSETDERVDREACRKVGLRSMIVYPMKHFGETVAVIKVLSPEPNAFDGTSMRILGLMADMIAATMFYSGRYGNSGLLHRATHDELTGIANRALFFDRFRGYLANAATTQSEFTILNFDMDGLKTINDGFGHRAGDAALREYALRVGRILNPENTFARVGGDEFGALLASADADATQNLIQRIHAELSAFFAFEDRPINLATSIGFASYPKDGQDINGLWGLADQRMYENKRLRKGIAMRKL